MKNNMMKKLLTLVLAGAMTLSLAACGSKTDPNAGPADPAGTEAKTYKVAVIKQLDHASLTRSQTPSPPSWIRLPPTTA